MIINDELIEEEKNFTSLYHEQFNDCAMPSGKSDLIQNVPNLSEIGKNFSVATNGFNNNFHSSGSKDTFDVAVVKNPPIGHQLKSSSTLKPHLPLKLSHSLPHTTVPSNNFPNLNFANRVDFGSIDSRLFLLF